MTEQQETGFLVPPGLAEELFGALRENFTAMDAWYETVAADLPRIPWHRKARYKWSGLRERAGRAAFRVIAGYELEEE